MLSASYAKPGDVLFYQEEVASDLYFLVTGKVNLFATFSVRASRVCCVQRVLLFVTSISHCVWRQDKGMCSCGSMLPCMGILRVRSSPPAWSILQDCSNSLPLG